MVGLMVYIDDYENAPYTELIECDSLEEAKEEKRKYYPGGTIIEYEEVK